MSLRSKITLITFGFILFMVLLELTLRLAGFTMLAIQEFRNQQSMKSKGACRIMCLGESTTRGQYPRWLEDELNQRQIGIQFSVIDQGVDATTSAAILNQLETDLEKYQPDIVVAMMGINDYGPHLPYEAPTASKYKLFLRSLKTYKLFRLLSLRIATKLDKIKDYYSLAFRAKEIPAVAIVTEDIVKKPLEFHPGNSDAYYELGCYYDKQGKFPQAQEAFQKAIELEPGNSDAYVGLGWCYENQSQLSQAQEAFQKAIELDPGNSGAYSELGWCYKHQGKLSHAEKAFKKAIALDPASSGIYYGLGCLYEHQGKLHQAKEALKKAMALNLENDRLCAALAVLCEKMGELELAQEYAQKAEVLRLHYYNHFTANNFRQIKEILLGKGIRLVLVQYPMRSIALLKKVFQGNETGIVFVDNERLFKEAVKQEGYSAYFKDLFAGDFGHCTDKGNQLLAGNIANGITKEIFNK